MQVLEYTRWGKVIGKAKLACELSENIIKDHFADVSKMVAIGSNAQRKQEITEEYFNSLDENKKRLITRGQTIDKNKTLYKVAKDSGVQNYGKFTNSGYQGLYGVENAKQIAKRKGLTDKDEILDYMSSEELVDNLFRIV